MIKQSIVSMMKICLLVFFVTLVSSLAGCKKSSTEQQSSEPVVIKAPAQEGVTETSSPPVLPVPVETPPAEKISAAKTTNTQQGSPKAQAQPAVGLEPINIELPKPMFIGTPVDVTVTNLEKSQGNRPPFLAPAGTKNVALKKPVTSSDQAPVWGEMEMITDGDKEAADGSFIEMSPGLQYVTIDLQGEFQIYAIIVWHYHKQSVVYYDVIVQIADDPDFISNVKTVFNNDIDNSAGQGVGKDMHYTETYEGKLIDCMPGVRGRYVRLYSNGGTGGDLNHYIEVEVYGKPVEGYPTAGSK